MWKTEDPAPRLRGNLQSNRQPSIAVLAEGLAASLCGYIVCGLFGPYLMSWFPFILMGLISATIKMKQQDTAASYAKGSL
jgi:hypothetical protein